MRYFLWLAFITACLLGCGSQPANEAGRVGRALEVASRSMPSARPESATPGADETENIDPISQQRKIIYTAQVSLVVADFAKAETRVAELVKRFGGYIAESNVDRTQGSQRTGKWVVRVPVDKFNEFLDAAVEIGVPETRHTNAQDVTEEYVDLEARMANKKEIERRIIKLLEDRSGDIKDVIAVENELGRVREDIERMEGRLRYLANMTALTTVTILAREQQNYVPPQAPTFTAQIGQTWSASIQSLKETAEEVVLLAVAVAPWMPVLVVVLAPLVWFVRRRRKRPITLPGAGS